MVNLLRENGGIRTHGRGVAVRCLEPLDYVLILRPLSGRESLLVGHFRRIMSQPYSKAGPIWLARTC